MGCQHNDLYFSCHDNEETFASLHEQIIKKLTPAGSQVDNKGKQGPSKCSNSVTIHNIYVCSRCEILTSY